MLIRTPQNPGSLADKQDIQRDRLLRSTARLDVSSRRLDNSLRIGEDAENTGAWILRDLKEQTEQIKRTREQLDKSDTYLEKSMKTLKEMSRRYVRPLHIYRLQ